MISRVKREYLIIAAVSLLLLVGLGIYIGLRNELKWGAVKRAPYPYKSMLAICSDIDGSTLEEFESYHRYMNTLEDDTKWGKGLGLDVSDSFWMYTMNNNDAIHDSNGGSHENVMTYFKSTNNDIKNADKILHYFKSGWIDSMHTYGDFSQVDENKPVFERKYAEAANAEMVRTNLLPTVWMNHGNAANTQSFRDTANKKDSNAYQQGSLPGSKSYHADLTVPNGVKFIWFSEPDNRFNMVSPLYPVTLDDNQKVWGFQRYTGKYGVKGFEYNWSVYQMDDQLSVKNLDKLVKNKEIAIVAQHLGGSNGSYILPKASLDGLKLLAEYYNRKDVLVGRTSRVLEFVRIRDSLNYTYTSDNAKETIVINSIDDPVLGTSVPSQESLKGISFKVKNPQNTEVYIGSQKVDENLLLRSSEDEETVCFKWYEADTRDYTIE